MINNLLHLSNFPVFSWSQEALNPLLNNIRIKQAALLAKMDAMPPNYKEEANKKVLVLDIYATLMLIGYSPDPNTISALVFNKLNNRPAILSSEIDKCLFNYINMILEDAEHYKMVLTKERILNWHKTVAQLNFSSSEILPLELSAEQEIQLDRFLIWFNKPGLDRLIKAAIAHLWFQIIFPFKQTKEVLAGFISNIQLAKADCTAKRFYSVSKQILQEQYDYHFILAQTQNGSLDITIWLQWYIGCLERSYDNAQTFLSPVFKKDKYWRQKKEVSFNNRQKIIVQKLLDNEQLNLTTTIYAQLANCARDTALRDVTNLIQKGILNKAGGLGKNTRYQLN